MEIHVDVYALKINLKSIRNLSNAMATILSMMPITLTNIVVNFGCLATNHKVMKCKIVKYLYYLLPVFIYIFFVLCCADYIYSCQCRLHLFLSVQTATRKLSFYSIVCHIVIIIPPLLHKYIKYYDKS